MPRFLQPVAGFLLALCAAPVQAEQNQICQAPDISGIGQESFFKETTDSASEAITLEAGRIEAVLVPEPRASMSGGVLLRRGQRLAGAETASYEPTTMSLSLDGDVRYRDPTAEVTSDSALFSYTTGRVVFDGAEFQLGQGGARGVASEIEISREGTLKLGDVGYTTCPPGSNDWLLEADAIELDTNTGRGTARNVALRFQGIPFLYAPRLSFPLGNARKTGFLAPEIGSVDRSGTEIRIPFYWNIAENYDATLTPRLLTDRGMQYLSEFRYLTERNEGVAQLEYLPNDEKFGATRSYVQYDHRTLFENGWRGLIDYAEASDGRYFEDLRASLSATSITHLNRSLIFDFYGDHWSFFGRVQDYQTIDETIVPDDQPYRRVPQLRIRAALPQQPLGLRASVDGEIVNFDRNTGVTGWRVDLQPRLDWSISRPGWFVTPEVLLQHTRYDLTNTEAGQRTDPSRTLPIASLDSGLFFERPMRRGANWIQTLEPRVLYVHVPYREQGDFPVFDTIIPDLNLVQLFRKNRFLGVDRVADTDQLSIGITSRILDGENGEEILSATIGQSRYLSAQGVTLPDTEFATEQSTDFVAEMRFRVFRSFNFDIGHQWGSGDTGTTRSEARLQYRPASRKILNLAYRFRRGSLEQGDLSWSWPLAQKWNVVGRYNYSIRDREVLEQLFGLEYESCCWGLRVVSRRYVSTREGTQDSSFGLQLVLKGMASVGSSTDRQLERGILGYSSDFN